mgnify:CR=1 FL=1
MRALLSQLKLRGQVFRPDDLRHGALMFKALLVVLERGGTTEERLALLLVQPRQRVVDDLAGLLGQQVADYGLALAAGGGQVGGPERGLPLKKVAPRTAKAGPSSC